MFLHDGERVLMPDEYTLSARFCDEDIPVSPIADGYAVDGGEYGVYSFTLGCGGRTASFGLWNTNNWWRTSVILRLSQDGSGIEQVNCVMNNNPPFIETFFIPWTQPECEPDAPSAAQPSAQKNPPYDRRHTEDCCLCVMRPGPDPPGAAEPCRPARPAG
ncbi:MAG: hypothetical protein ACI4O7_07515 [Aristaeellaceae bacterium]